MKDVGDAMQRDAIDDHGARSIDDCDLRFRVRFAGARRIRIDVRDVESAAIGRGRDVARAAPCGQALFFFAGLSIEHGNVVADAIGDEEAFAVAVFDDA